MLLHSLEQLKALAERQAKLLHAHTPKLKDFSDPQPESPYHDHLMHTLNELGMGGCSLYAGRMAEWRGWAKNCQLCSGTC
jgi:hypothetical protein